MKRTGVPLESRARLILTYLRDQEARRQKWEAEMKAVTNDESVRNADDPPVCPNPIFDDLCSDHVRFYTMCGFSERDFLTLYGLMERLLTKPKRGRKVAVGPIDGFLLLFHWLRTATPIDSIAGAFHLRLATLDKTLKKMAMEIHGQLAGRFIATPSRDRWTAGEKFSDCGLIVDATVQKRGRPAGEFAEARLFFSGKYHIYLK
jgi:hypothetical protein